jgi:hypothetical protein
MVVSSRLFCTPSSSVYILFDLAELLSLIFSGIATTTPWVYLRLASPASPAPVIENLVLILGLAAPEAANGANAIGAILFLTL